MTKNSHVHLILDKQSVAEARGVTFHLNRATKHPENPVMLPGEPHEWDSQCVCWPGTVLYSPSDSKFRCWYVAMDVVQIPDRTWYNGYAESDDGIHWRKPELGQVEFLGRPTNQIKPAWNPYFLSTAFENPLPNAPAGQRFGGYWTEHARFGGEVGDWTKSLCRKSLAWSPDGIHWTLARTAYAERLRAPFLDISQVLYDPGDPDPAFRWKAYGQRFRARTDGRYWPGIRHIGLAHGADVGEVEDFSEPFVLSPDPAVEEELHFAAVQKIGGDYLMLFESDTFTKNPIHGDLRLAVSNDGRSFRRVHPHSPLVATGPKGMWDENLLVTTSAGWQEVGDEVWIHYFGCPNIFRSWPLQYAVDPVRSGSRIAPVYLGLATLPRDRFAYVAGPGVITTHALNLGNDVLWLNTDGDHVTISVIDHSGKATASGRLSDERRQTVYRKVIWDGNQPREGQLQIKLEADDRLYSILH